VRFPCVHAAATTPAQRLNVFFAHFIQTYQSSPKGLSGRPAHCPFSRLARRSLALRACTLALSPIRDTLIEGVSHFVTSMTAPIASGWSGCPVGLAPTGKRRLCTAHTHLGHLLLKGSGPIRASSTNIECCPNKSIRKTFFFFPAVSNRFHPKTTAVNQAQE
jgi:hypothetical protein